MNVPDLLTAAAAAFPEHQAAVFPKATLSYASLDYQSSQIASRLTRRRIGRGKRVALLHENSPAALVSFWGVQKAGAATVDIPAQSAPELIASILRESAPAAIATTPQQLKRMTNAGLTQGFPPVVILESPASTSSSSDLSVELLDEIFRTEPADISALPARPDDVAIIIYTSGTTGRPKGVMLSHTNLISNLTALNGIMRLSHDDSVLMVVPMNYIHGRMQLLLHTLAAGTVVFSAGFQMPQAVLNELSRHRVTGFSGVPFHFKSLMTRTNLKTTPLPGLRYVMVTGGAMAPSELRELADALPAISIHVGYGQTEASPRMTCLEPEDVFRKPESCGRALPGVVIGILDDDGNALPQGEIGEVVVTGPNVMKGYVSGDERESGKIDALGRLHTGDLGRLDADGWLYLAGRKSEMIKSAGERIFPGEVEEVINSLPEVRESAVFGMPDPLLGERVVALVVPANGATLTEELIRSQCLQSLPFVRNPKEIYVVEQLPHTASGKIDRSAVRSLARIEQPADAPVANA